MKKIWIVISGVDFEDCQNIEGCFESLESAKKKADELKANIPGEWGNDYIQYAGKEKVMLPHKWSNRNDYLEIEEQDLYP